MPRKSAGILMYRYQKDVVEVLLVHPGCPFWGKKDLGIWSIPKGEFKPLKPLKQPSNKIITAWAVEGDCDASKIKSNTFTMEWPPHSGKEQEFPEVDRAAWFTIDMAERKLLKGQK
ncbi:MAG: hypothetical protein MRK02_05180 [Candidatus Scalindua sp.]|nr:hypothetical protein [Candidatus Scalindua sp.]